ncbi:MAG: PH domain-containing protein [Flavobacteriaceae bacterium]|nr:PH domain-containing protein [Flavobacteriaceae bacterium]
MFQNQEIEHLPTIKKLNFKRIHKDYLKVILIHFIIIFAIIFTGLFICIEFKLKEIIPNFTWVIYLVVSVVFTIVFVFFLIGFSKRKYALREKDISYKSGVLIKKITTVPFSRVQHVEVDEGPISRLFQLASISVYTAGDSSDDLEIKGIKKTEALQIKEFISQQING